MRTSLKSVVLGAVALVLTAMVSIFLVIDVLGDMEAARQRVAGDANRIATIGAPLVLGALVVDDLATAEQALKAMNVDETLAVLRLVGADGAKLLDVAPAKPRKTATPDWFRALLAVEVPGIRVPIEGGGMVYGTIVAVPGTHAVEDDAWLRVRSTAIEALVLLILLILAVERALAWGLRPIRDLAQAATRFGRGELAARMAPTRTAEVFETANAFNAMADQVQGLLGELRSKNAANRRLAAAVQQSDEAIVTVDTERRITAWNGGAETLFGIAAGAALGQPLAMLVRNRPAAEQAAWVEWVLTASSAAPFESALTVTSGRIEVAASASTLTDEAGAPAGWVAFLRDVTARRRYEQRLAEAKHQAELANRSKSEFLANMSHELRTPLNAVIGFSQVMRDGLFGPLGNKRYTDYANDIHASGEHLLALINDLLDVSAIEAERLDLHEAELDPRDIADVAIRLVQQRAVDGQIALHCEVAERLPMLRADPRRLKQMLLNLLSNAVKFTAPGGRVTLTIECSAAGELEFRIADNGIGMDAAGITTALERFGQVDGGLARRHEGTGLGLPLTKGLAELHGGALRIESARGVGTRAIITLPAERLLPAAPATAAVRGRSAA
jgi:PAS domain S-box-containing protein